MEIILVKIIVFTWKVPENTMKRSNFYVDATVKRKKSIRFSKFNVRKTAIIDG